ncbi:hypothetical protein GWI33_018137 [Rhynchophorus ferrugineus]|uniref:Uncharacterized protein n=1 Tax=Rhynchophorus ferrugineus TaxID=354439 RepID=A0A834HWQ3_RHYFE|nr:hypothetical protein GWI33_018137 [Rhynchophorus ferrugineus]
MKSHLYRKQKQVMNYTEPLPDENLTFCERNDYNLRDAPAGTILGTVERVWVVPSNFHTNYAFTSSENRVPFASVVGSKCDCDRGNVIFKRFFSFSGTSTHVKISYSTHG